MHLLEGAGAEAVDLGIVRDDESALEAVLRDAVDNLGVDAVISSGGVSMGDYDIVKSVLSRIADMSWFQIAMKPARQTEMSQKRTRIGRTMANVTRKPNGAVIRVARIR